MELCEYCGKDTRWGILHKIGCNSKLHADADDWWRSLTLKQKINIKEEHEMGNDSN